MRGKSRDWLFLKPKGVFLAGVTGPGIWLGVLQAFGRG